MIMTPLRSAIVRGNIVIDGDFTNAGVIYGTSSWTASGNSATGSLTGLIGAEGAIGAFVSSGENTNEVYTGGFVAALCELY